MKITLATLFFIGCSNIVLVKSQIDQVTMDRKTRIVFNKTSKFLNKVYHRKIPLKIPEGVQIKNIIVDKYSKSIVINFSPEFSLMPFRPENVELIYHHIKRILGWRFRRYRITVKTLDQPIENLIPNFYRTKENYDLSRMPDTIYYRQKQHVQKLSTTNNPTKGLKGSHVALWHSHGWYYNNVKDRWQWGRPRLFQTVEDILPMSFTLPYLIPMLENAGANVYVPRERDTQINEVVIDNDLENSKQSYIEFSFNNGSYWKTGTETGFAVGTTPYLSNENPFRQGSYHFAVTDTISSAEVNWIPDIPETGNYSVQVAYHSAIDAVADAHYSVFHAGGKTEFVVDQRMGGGTWIYLGTFKFYKGVHPDSGKVVLSNKSSVSGKLISADAVKFGGGMGNIARNGKVSTRARYLEAARYYLQYAGMPDTLVYNLNSDSSDYKDDYQGRGEWVNYLRGAPFGPNKNRQTQGLGIPIDMSMAFHTDAGKNQNDMAIGTLSIYSLEDMQDTIIFPDGMSRLANRDLADLVQTQIVQDIHARYDSTWLRRGLWNSDYSEVYRTNVPSVLLELLSHQNFTDMKFAHDPVFRFDISRAIYKAILKFLATQNQYDYVVQPLPVTHFKTEFTNPHGVRLSWKPVLDPLEKSAKPDKYIVYTRIDSNGFDNGVPVDLPEITFDNLKPGIIYSYKVTAINDGGESFPSEILSVCRVGNDSDPVLIINGFDRVSAPAVLESDNFSGFADFWDQGVPDRYDLNYTGSQFNFFLDTPWAFNDAPGHGASHADFETTIIPGNTFDFPYLHGKSIMRTGHSFVSSSDEAVEDSVFAISQYRYIDLILGEEKETNQRWTKGIIAFEKQFKTFSDKLRKQIIRYCDSGGNLFISGAYVGADLFSNQTPDDSAIQFARDTLKYTWVTDQASKTGSVFSADSLFGSLIQSFKFNTSYNSNIYTVEAPDAIDPISGISKTVLRYAENHFSAGVAFSGNYKTIIFGFPFETILNQDDRDKVMKAIFRHFNYTTEK